MVIITDAPCHGKKFHSTQDTYPNGCPAGIDIEQLIFVIGKRDIDLNVVIINETTQKMYQIFNSVYQEACKKQIIQLKLGSTGELGKNITKTVSATITATIGTSGGKTKDIDEQSKAFRFLRAHKGLLNTKCLSHTELQLSQLSKGTTQNELVINEEDEELEDGEEEEEEQEEEEKKEGEKEQNDSGQTDIEKVNEQWDQYKKIYRAHEGLAGSNNPSSKIKSEEKVVYYPCQITENFRWYTGLTSTNSFNFSCNYFTPQVDNRQPVDWNNPTIKVQQLTSKCRIHKQYFAEGAMRFAFYAFDTVQNQKLVAKLHKNLKDNSDFELMKRDSMSLIACHYFAEEFNSRILIQTTSSNNAHHQNIPILLNFVNSTIQEVIGHVNKDIKYYFVENLIEGNYQKYNNNAGWTNEEISSVFNETTQAFSHFTWQYSGGQLLVVDIQGGAGGTLTDPQIHTKARSKLYGKGDLGYEGMMRFFWTHKCNQFCKQLELIHPREINKIPDNFDFFSDLFGLEEIIEVNINENQPEKEKDEIIAQKKVGEDDEDEGKEIEKQNDKKKKKKKRGAALKAEQEKEKALEEEKLREQKALEEKKLKSEVGQQIKQCEIQVGVQCCLCKKCFFVKKQTILNNKKNKVEFICEDCQKQCAQTQIDLACTLCGNLFQISKFYCNSKKINLIGKCVSCRD